MVSIFLAKVLGLYFSIFAIFVLLKRENVKALMLDLVNNRGTFFLVALITLITGILIVASHNIWILGWPLLITILGWVILISGIIRLFCRDFIEKRMTFWQKDKSLTIFAVIILIIGLFLLYQGYVG